MSERVRLMHTVYALGALTPAGKKIVGHEPGCPKCGANGVTLLYGWVGLDDMGPVVRTHKRHAESLVCTCATCGFAWYEPTLDTPSAATAPTAEHRRP